MTDLQTCEHWHTGSVVRLVVSCQSTYSTFSFSLYAFQLRAVFTIPHQQPVHSCAADWRYCTPFNANCINMQMLADTNTHAFLLAAGGAQPLSQLLCVEALSLSPPAARKHCSSLVGISGARRSPTEQTGPSVPRASLKQGLRANPSFDSVKPHCVSPHCAAPAAAPSCFLCSGKKKACGAAGADESFFKAFKVSEGIPLK